MKFASKAARRAYITEIKKLGVVVLHAECQRYIDMLKEAGSW